MANEEEEIEEEDLDEYSIEDEEDIADMPPPPPPDDDEGVESELEDVKGYDKEELEKEIGREKQGEEEPKNEQEKILVEIQEERKRLEEERKKLSEEKKKKEEERKRKEEEVKKPHLEKVQSFAKERRKRKQLRHLRTNLFIGQYLLLIVFVIAVLFSEGVSADPLYLPIEHSIYIIAIILLAVKIERRVFRYLNIKYSGTIQRKALGTNHYTNVEMPETVLSTIFVVILLIPVTRGFISVLLDIIGRDGDVIPFSDNFVLFLGLIILTGLITSIVWVLFLQHYKVNIIGPDLKKIEEAFVIEDVFLISSSGLLIKHLSRALRPGIDDDILTGMLTAVKEFVKDSFRSSAEGELDELQYGELRILLEYGADVYLAVVIKGQESAQLRPEIRRTLKQITKRFGTLLKDWDGDLGKVKDVGPIMRALFDVV